MTHWNFDFSSIPRGYTETREKRGHWLPVFKEQTIWVELKDGTVKATYYRPPTGSMARGIWSNGVKEDDIVAWQGFVKPEPSGIGKRVQTVPVVEIERV